VRRFITASTVTIAVTTSPPGTEVGNVEHAIGISSLPRHHRRRIAVWPSSLLSNEHDTVLGGIAPADSNIRCKIATIGGDDGDSLD
jgi:hypothetical protein